MEMRENERTREITFEEEFSCLERDVKDFFKNYKNQGDSEDGVEVCLIRSGYRAAKKAREEINRQKAENEELIYKLECLLCHATDGKLSKHTYDLKTMEVAVTDAYNEMYTDGYNEGESEARKEFAERLKKKFHAWQDDRGNWIKYIPLDYIDNLLAEMEERV
jgi:hypothetical protein